MGLFYYSARDVSGKKYTGEVDAVNESMLATSLQKQGFVPIEIKRKRKEVGFKLEIPKIRGGVSGSTIVAFTRQLSTMIATGLPLTNALKIMQEQTNNRAFSDILKEVTSNVEEGMSLSSALSKHPKAFNNVYVNLVAAGETGGVLDKVLSKLADSLEKERDFKAKTKGAFIYPVIVVVVMIVVVSIMMIFVIPKLTDLYTEVGASLPLPTKILIAMSNFMRSYWWLLLIVVSGLVVGLKFLSKTPGGRNLFSKIIFALPIWGKIRKTLILSQFTRTLGLLVSAGIPIVTALKVVRGLLESPEYEGALDNVIARVEKGSTLHQPLVSNPIFPPIVGQMVKVGEETGKVDDVLTRLSIYFEGESENLIRNLTTALEPVILVMLGLGVGVLVLSIILPIYNLTSQF
jgi:type IV pilus assembly protein PilC